MAVLSNFSVGVLLLLDLVKLAAKVLPQGWDIEVVEAHHNQKLMLRWNGQNDCHSSFGRVSQNPNLHISDIPASSCRRHFWRIYGLMCGPGERLEIKNMYYQTRGFCTWRSVGLNGYQQPNGLYIP